MKSYVQEIKEFNLPKYNEIPDVGLYLEQVVKYINSYLSILTDNTITNSMVSNYVKKGLVSNPIKKQYSREQIAKLLFIAIAKLSLSLEDIQLLMNHGLSQYTAQKSYSYFCDEFKSLLDHVFEVTDDDISKINGDKHSTKLLLRNTIVTITYQIYVSRCFKELHMEEK